MSQTRQLRSRTQRTQNESWFIFCAERVGSLARNFSTCESQLVDSVFDSIFSQICPVGSKGICFNRIYADSEIGIVDRSDEVRSCDIENLIAAFVVLKIFEGWIRRLQHGAHSAICNHSSGGESLTQKAGAWSNRLVPIRHGAEVTVRCRYGDSPDSDSSFSSDGYRFFWME